MSASIPDPIRERIARAIGCLPGELPADDDGLLDVICPMLADHAHVRRAYIIGMQCRKIPTSNADGPLSARQMMDILYNENLGAASDASDLAEVHSRLTAAGYVPAPGETTGDLVARALRDTREADDRRDEAERETDSLREQLRAAQEHARDLAEQLNNAAAMVLRMSNTICRVTN